MTLLAYRLAGEEPPTKPRRGTYRVRKGGLENLYLQRDGSLGAYGSARIFTTQNAADKAGQALFGQDFGIF